MMKPYPAGSYDIAVIGAGHAGIEAALAAARLGCRTIIFTISLDAIGNMPCNPSIGGTAKGHLVRELDALGGEMAKAADATMLQSRMLNLGKGPAVHSLRLQCDRKRYHMYMKAALENQPNLSVRQAEIVSIDTDGAGEITSVTTAMGGVYSVRAVILATGTFLRGKIFVGEYSEESGPDGMHPAARLSDSLRALGIPLRRFKTGTPARVHGNSVDFTRLEEQHGDEPPVAASFATDPATLQNKLPCYIGYTNEETHEVIRQNIGRSPLYGGAIEGIGPRYCPSIEDKVMRFAEKPRHQFFLEPMGENTREMYLSGLSSSLPEEVQTAFYRTIPGLEQVELMRTAYAIEYDCIDPTNLKNTLEFKAVPHLYGAGQFNGTSGYEEAAVQGFVAGANAALKLQGKPPFLTDRSTSYIGTLVDDLVTKGCMDPYRMMTSRSEYRLLLRQDNADARLMPQGYALGLIPEERWQQFLAQQAQKEQEKKRLEKYSIAPTPPSMPISNRWAVPPLPSRSVPRSCSVARRSAMPPSPRSIPTAPRSIPMPPSRPRSSSSTKATSKSRKPRCGKCAGWKKCPSLRISTMLPSVACGWKPSKSSSASARPASARPAASAASPRQISACLLFSCGSSSSCHAVSAFGGTNRSPAPHPPRSLTIHNPHIKCAAGTLRAYLRRRTDDAFASFVSSRSLSVRGSWGTAPSAFCLLLRIQK